MSFIGELKRRNVFKVGVAYAFMAWLLAQITDVFLENFGSPDWVIKTILLLLLIGFPGKQERFEQAMKHVKTVHDELKAQGASSNIFFMNEAAHLAMAGDLEGSLDYLDRAISGGLITSLRITQRLPYFEPLEGDPRFEAIQTRMVEHLDSERAKLGLEPATI